MPPLLKHVTPARLLFVAVLIVLAMLSYEYYSHSGFLKPHRRAVDLFNQGRQMLPHFGFPLFSTLLHRLSNIPLQASSHLVLCFHVIFTFVALHHVMTRMSQTPPPQLFVIFAAVALMLVAPIGLPYMSPSIYSFYYINRSTALWRNPTHTTIQPYLILTFGYCCLLIGHYVRQKEIRKDHVWIAGVALFFATMMKPHFTLSFLPALGLYWWFYHRGDRRLLYALAWLVGPALVLLLLQSYLILVDNPLNFLQQRDTSLGKVRHIEFAPFAVWKANNKIPWLSALLAMVFPLYISALRFNRLQFPIKLAWLNLFIAMLPYALLRESGDRDFEWGMWYGLQLLFLAAVLEWLRWRREAVPSEGKAGVISLGMALFSLHALFGLVKWLRAYPL